MGKIEKLKSKLDLCIEQYVILFCKKQDLQYKTGMWVAGDVGYIVLISDMFINFSDIRLDLENNVTKGIFSEWYWTVTESNLPYINYSSWLKGLRQSDTKQS